MEELLVGKRFNNKIFPSWYNEIDEVIHQKGDKALIKYHTDYGSTGFAYCEKENGMWRMFISSPNLTNGLLYPYLDEIDVSKYQ